ncbi:hypothetical protein GCM10025795_39690 [Verticiella sediminum]
MRLGMVDYAIDDPFDWQRALQRLLSRCASAAPRALAQTKHLARAADGMLAWRTQGLPEYLDDAARVFAAQMRRDAVEGVRAARKKRAPVWPE